MGPGCRKAVAAGTYFCSEGCRASYAASNTRPASNKVHLTSGRASNALLTASNREVMPGGLDSSPDETPAELVATAPSAGTKQRWDKAKYNAYQREYMRRRRES